MQSDANTEPVVVYVRVRPEFEDRIQPADVTKHSPNKSLNSSWSSVTANSRGVPQLSSSLNNCCSVVGEQTVRLTPPDAVYGSRKAVSAVDDKLYTFDQVFPDDTTQEDVYKNVAEHVAATVRGYNTTIFAYGATGSGKSFTMTGDKTAPGVIPRAIGDLFRHIEKMAAAESDVFFYVRLSYVELYNNNFRNLLEHIPKESKSSHHRSSLSSGASVGSVNGVNLSMSGFFTELDDHQAGEAQVFEAQHGVSFAAGRNHTNFSVAKHPGFAVRTDKIEVRESQSAGVFLAGPNLRIPVTSALEAYQLIAKGNKMRATGSTHCNDVSSR